MPVGVTLLNLLNDLKAEANISMNVAHGVQARDAQVYLLRRVQEELYTQHDWPTLAIDRDVALSPGQRYYNFPADIDFAFVNSAVVRNATIWEELCFGIGSDELNTYNSDDDFRTFPPRNWDYNGDTGQFEVWPVPSQAGTLRFYGRKKLRPLAADTDTCTLDSTLIVLYAAAEMLARVGSEDAPLKLQKAQAHFTAIKRRLGANKRKPFAVGAGGGDARSRVGIDYIPSGYGKGY